MTVPILQSRRKILLIGWDAADWNVALPLVEAGKMPALKRLMDQSAWGKLATLNPVLSPMLWTSIATGKRAWKHGIHGFSEPCPSSGGIRPITNLSRKAKAVWNIFNQNDFRNHVIGWWPSHPAEPINGVMVSNHFQQARADLDKPWPLRPGTVHPPRLADSLAEMRIHPAELINEDILPFVPHADEIDQTKDKRLENCAKILAEISGIHAAATATLQLEPWDFAAVYYDGIDHFGHGFMRYHPPRLPWVDEQDFELYRDVVEGAYRFHDMMLDVLLRIAGDDTTVLLMSDHGFEPGKLRVREMPNEPAGPAAEHSPFGIFCLRGPDVREGERIQGASLLDIAPTLLHLAGLPVGRDMDGRVLVNCFKTPQTVRFIDSWEDVQGACGQHPSGTEIDDVDAQQSLRQLIELGYIDEPNPNQAKAVAETTRELRYNLAQAYGDGGRHPEAARIYRELWDRWPEESRFGTRLLLAYLAIEEPGLARATYELLLERKRAAAENARTILSEMDAVREASEAASRADAEARGEDHVPPPVNLGEKQKIRRLTGQANTNDRALAYLEGSVLALENRLPEAIVALRRAVDVEDSLQPSLQKKFGDIYFKFGDLPTAESSYRQVLYNQPDNFDAYLGLARVCLQSSRPFEAAAHAKSATDLGFSQARAHALYGVALFELGKPGLAAKSLRTALALNPWNIEAHETIANLYARRSTGADRASFHREQAEVARQKIAETKASLHSAGEAESVPLPEFPPVNAIGGRISPADGAPLVVVSGLPRSGTSLMMQMLAAANIPVVTDTHRAADESNLRGYFEDERVKRLPFDEDRSWLTKVQGQAIKIVAPLLHYVSADLPMKIVFLQRPPGELIASQHALLKRDGKIPPAGGDVALARGFTDLLARVNQLLDQRPKWELLPVSFHDAVYRPEETARAVATFLGMPRDTAAMAAAADPNLHRTRS
jgi:predicted AlkP superfamily phosphohydrolase/phosphomutase/tetratricopeptide (TPR) repeat protein